MNKHFDYGTLVVRCNHCNHIWPEDAIQVKDDGNNTEYCEDCGGTGAFMDLGEFGVEEDKVLFPELSKCRDWELVKDNCSLDTLCYFENEISDYLWSYGIYSAPVDDYPSIIQWLEGIIGTKELLENFGEGQW